MDTRLLLPVWVAGSLILYTVITRVLYRGGGRLADRADATALGGLALELGGLLYFAGIPLLATLSGVLSFDLTGLGRLWSGAGLMPGFTPAEWLRGAGEALGVSAVALLMLAGARRATRVGHTVDGAGASLTGAIKDEAHWMLYRAPGTLFLNDPLLGVLSGAGLTLFEWVLHPRFLSRGLSRERRWALLIRLTALMVSAALYLGTRNLWLMILAGAVIRLSGDWLGARVTRASE
jgi:hypothetical protein